MENKIQMQLKEVRSKMKNTEQDYAGFGIRLVARIIDEMIIFVIPIIVFALLSFTQSPAFIFIILLWWALPENAYYIYFHKKTGQTIGKKALGLKVVKTDGNNLSWGGAFLRRIGYKIGEIPLFLGQIWIAIDKEKQGWHDKIAHTYVVKVEKTNE